MNTRPNGMQRKKPRKADLLTICKRQFPDLDFFDDMTVAQLREYIRIHGCCEVSGWLFNGGTVHYDHVTPNAILFEGDAVEWQVLTPEAHKEKTRQDVKNIAKCDRLMGRTGQLKRRKARGRSLIQGRKEIQSRGFQKAPDGYSAWKTKSARVKQLDESYE